jgi:hypothetical protein
MQWVNINKAVAAVQEGTYPLKVPTGKLAAQQGNYWRFKHTKK